MTLAELLPALAETAIASSVAILLVLAVRHPLRNTFGPGIAYAAWLLVPLSIIAVLLPAPTMELAARPVVAVMQMPTQLVVAGGTQGAMAGVIAWFGVMWLAGVIVMTVSMTLHQRRFLRALGGIEHGDRDVVVANAVAGLPAVIGLWRPRIVLPSDAAQRYDTLQRELMLVHERTHIVRVDLHANAACALLRCLFWFNPLVHIAAARFRHDQELACDQQVMARHPNARRSYGEAMLKTQLAGVALPLGCHWGQTHPLKERIDMLRKPLPTFRRRLLGSAVATGLLLTSAYAVWAAQPAAPKTEPALTGAGSAGVVQAAPGGTDQAGPVGAALPANPPPKYPQLAAEQKVEGRVMLVVDVAIDGSAAAVELERSSGDASLDAAAMKAAKSWKYQPAVEKGKPVASRVRVPIDFKMDQEDAGDAGASDQHLRPKAERSASARSYDRMIASFGEGIWKPVTPPRPSADDC